MTRLVTFTLAALIAGGSAFALFAGESEFPDLVMTPGAIASMDVHDVCGVVNGLSYSKRHRATTPEMKREVRRSYGLNGFWRGEIDHRVPLCLGGADDIRNLWPQADYKAKDELEAATCRAVCEGRMSLPVGQAIFLGDWRSHLK